MLKIETLTFNMFGVNTYIVYDTDTREAAVIDPGMISDAERRRIDSFIAAERLHVGQLINTHMHVDHIFGDRYIASRYGTGVAASTDDAFLGEKAQMQARMFQLPVDVEPVAIDLPLHDGDTLTIAGAEARIMAIPGHSPGSLVIYFPEQGWAVTGDVLFAGGIGRTDLVGGNHSQLVDGIRSRLFALPDSTVVYPGHGPATTIGREKLSGIV